MMTQAQTTKNILPADAETAMQKLISLSQKLVTMAESETQRLIQNDILGFALMQQEKEDIAGTYVRASEEFRARIHDFRGLDKNLLDRLENIQNDLAERTQSNNVMVDRLQKQSQKNAQSTLITAQELSQRHQVEFEVPEQDLAQNSQGA